LDSGTTGVICAIVSHPADTVVSKMGKGGKKKFKDVQFFTEVVEASQAIDGRHRSDYDADELGEEERERKMKQEMNKAFLKFCQRVEQVAEKDPASAWNRFEEPQRDLSFP
jgi:nucleosome binding factor SPN SPT16 subunit